MLGPWRIHAGSGQRRVMKRVLGVTVLLVAAPASAEVEVSRQLVKGEALTASWQSTDGCLATYVDLWGGEQVSLGGTQPEYAPELHVSVGRFDRCEGHWAIYADADVTSGFSIDGVNSAAIYEIPLTFYEEVCYPTGWFGWTCDIVELESTTLSATFSGDGDVSTGRFMSSSGDRRHRITFRDRGKHRDATATGTLMFEGENLLTGDFDGTLHNSTSGRIELTRY